MTTNEGYIKFSFTCTGRAPLPRALLEEMIEWRSRFYRLGLVGAYPGGPGFGNLSVRLDGTAFIITGSATGKFEKLDENHFARVTGFDLDKNHVTFDGPVEPSSESLTHAAAYSARSGIGGVIHIHSGTMWEKLLHIFPSTPPEFEYGTPQMARKIQEMIKSGPSGESGIIVMEGHEEGIIFYGCGLEEAGVLLMKHLPR